MRSLRVTIPGRPPTPNSRRHWRRVAADNEKWHEAAMYHADVALPLDWEPLERARILITFVIPDKRDRDLDNLIASTKPLTDGLVSAGVLVDDNIHVIQELTYGWRYQKGVNATEYHIEEI